MKSKFSEKRTKEIVGERSPVSAVSGGDSARAISRDEKPSLVMREDGLSLIWKDMVLRGDFTEMIPRIRSGNLPKELIVKAAKINQNSQVSLGETPRPLTIDATAGLGEDALLLAAAGFKVKLYERDGIIFSLLEDAVRRALELPDEEEYAVLKQAVSRMEISNEDSIAAMNSLKETSDLRPDVILLDPMFPERKKSSLVGKKLQILQQLESPCDDEEELLGAALSLNPRRLIIKRPPKGPYLAGVKPTFSYDGKSVRIDCIAR